MNDEKVEAPAEVEDEKVADDAAPEGDGGSVEVEPEVDDAAGTDEEVKHDPASPPEDGSVEEADVVGDGSGADLALANTLHVVEKLSTGTWSRAQGRAWLGKVLGTDVCQWDPEDEPIAFKAELPTREPKTQEDGW